MPQTNAPPGGPLPLSEAFAVGPLLQAGWDALSRSPVPLLLGAFVFFLIDGCTGGSGQFSPPSGEWSGDGSDPLGELERMLEEVGTGVALAIGAAVVGCGLVLQVVGLFAKSWVSVGWLRTHQAVVVEGDAELDLLFGGRDRLGPMVLWRLLVGLIQLGVGMVTLAPGLAIAALGAWRVWGDGGSDVSADALPFLAAGGAVALLVWLPAQLYVAPGLLLGDYAVVFEEASPMEALDRSWEAASGHRLALLLFLFAAFFVNALGLMLCCIGAIPARAITDTAATVGWLRFTRGDRAAWALRSAAGG